MDASLRCLRKKFCTDRAVRRCFLLTCKCNAMDSEIGMRDSDSQMRTSHRSTQPRTEGRSMDRSRVQAKQVRSGAKASGIAQGTMVGRFGAVPVSSLPGSAEPWCARQQSRVRAGCHRVADEVPASPRAARHGNAGPVTILTLPVCPRGRDATADKPRTGLHGLP
jgi:hypothetical protein